MTTNQQPNWRFEVWQEELCGTWYASFTTPWGDGPLEINALDSDRLFGGLRKVVLWNLNQMEDSNGNQAVGD